MTNNKSNRTFLYDAHLELGARMAPFGGFEMPIQYSGIVDEHLATRTGATVFDTCHMGEFRVRGKTAESDLEHIISCDIASMKDKRCRYGLLCNEQGAVLDDLLVYKFTADDFMLVVNAGTQGQDFAWIAALLSPGTIIENISARTGKIDLQGPESPKMAQSLLDQSIGDMIFYSFSENIFKGAPVLVSRTGYTGEIGFEFYAAPGVIVQLWNACIEQGATPAGLGARDTLRLEMGMPLYGHELSEKRNAADLGLSRAISQSKEFIGSKAIMADNLSGQLLRGIILPGRRAARQNDIVADPETGERIGEVTSGSFAPSMRKAIALAYINRDYAEAGRPVRVLRGRHELDGEIADTPFYKDGTARKKIGRFLDN